MLEHYKKIGIWPQTSRISKTYEVRHSRAHTANGWYWNGHNSNTLTCFMLVFYYHSTLFNMVSQEKSAQKHVIFFLVGRWIPFWFSVPTPFIIQSIRLPVIIKSGIVARVGRQPNPVPSFSVKLIVCHGCNLHKKGTTKTNRPSKEAVLTSFEG